ncbi:YchJ family protein [Parachitinimonas caeni]|uniref:UPF0225 protein PZA18_16480 n=1 Tax=Parachitinimonas caeni TaxID=3031301 RepID=A0ABT7E442_9NEIS|nr:YchJ family protein [Parachitinimonas caeni]MDK2125652.1 YchJ family protein [Parachitinimonas caeni]
MSKSNNLSCPCGSGIDYRKCCGPYHHGDDAPATAEALMRSRYSAYAMRKSDYLMATWHPETRPQELDLEGDSVKWVGLLVIATEAGQPEDRTGVVEFIARYKIGGRAAKLSERSRFERIGGRWLYIDGEVNE